MDHILYLLTQYKYILLFPLAIVEGPILAIIAGFLCSGSLLNPFIVYPIIVAGDITGDSLCYMLGRWGVPRPIKKLANWIGLNRTKMEQVRLYFNENPNRTISLSKITLGIGVAGIYLAGNSKIPYLRFIRICLLTSSLQYVFYLGTGLLFGNAYAEINHYLNFFASITIIAALAIVMFFVFKSIQKRL